MSESKKRSRRSKRHAVTQEDAPPPVVVDDDLTRLAIDSLPEQRRKEWERSQKNSQKTTVAADSVAEDSAKETAEDVAEEITRGAKNTRGGSDQTPTWYKIIMFGLIVIGLLWLIVWYLMNYSWPIPSLGYGNVAVGVGLMMLGLVMTTRWR